MMPHNSLSWLKVIGLVGLGIAIGAAVPGPQPTSAKEAKKLSDKLAYANKVYRYINGDETATNDEITQLKGSTGGDPEVGWDGAGPGRRRSDHIVHRRRSLPLLGEPPIRADPHEKGRRRGDVLRDQRGIGNLTARGEQPVAIIAQHLDRH